MICGRYGTAICAATGGAAAAVHRVHGVGELGQHIGLTVATRLLT
jgi:hypothetical protein